MIRCHIMLGLAAYALVSAPSSSQPVSSVPAPKVVSVDGSDLYRARKVIKKFYKANKRPECYDVLFSLFDGNLRVDFVPKTPDWIIYDNEPERAENKICGRNIGYIIDSDGNPIRKIYSR